MVGKETETPTQGPVGNGILGASPLLRSAKRALRLSPTTPVGLARKLQLCNQGQSIEQITFEEDVEMINLDHQREDSDLISIGYTQKQDQKSNKKIIRGMRRRLGCDVNMSNGSAEIDGSGHMSNGNAGSADSAVNMSNGSADIDGSGHMSNGSAGSTGSSGFLNNNGGAQMDRCVGSIHGGKNAKKTESINQAQKDKKYRKHKAKTKKRKEFDREPNIDPRQTLMNQYFVPEPKTNEIFVGSEKGNTLMTD